MADIIRELEKEQIRTDLPKLEIGDTVRVYVKVIEGSRDLVKGEMVDGPVDGTGALPWGFLGNSFFSATPQRLDAMK